MYTQKEREIEHIRKFIVDILFIYPRKISKLSRGLHNVRIKRAKSRTWTFAEFVPWSMLKIFVYVSRSFRPLPLFAKVSSQLLPDIENLGSALSWKVRSAILILQLSFEIVTRPPAKHALACICARTCMCEWVFDS